MDRRRGEFGGSGGGIFVGRRRRRRVHGQETVSGGGEGHNVVAEATDLREFFILVKQSRRNTAHGWVRAAVCVNGGKRSVKEEREGII